MCEPVALLSVAALPAVLIRRRPRWMLLLLFVVISIVFSALADLQAGGNINYFFEALLAITPIAVWGALRLCARSRWNARRSLVAGVLLVYVVLLGRGITKSHSRISPRAVLSENDQFRGVEARLRGLHIFSTVPQMALLDREPALMEPFLLSYLQQAGRFDPAPILKRVRAGEFDIVITAGPDFQESWRGVPEVPPDLKRSIASAYEPYCAVVGAVVNVPRNRPADSVLRAGWRQVGCVPQGDFHTAKVLPASDSILAPAKAP
ncbi:MAG: hypothetical protein JO307_20460 [Bryobacterales bacterium]|nr:hypothetical protein [Bryobacterales bacterium]